MSKIPQIWTSCWSAKLPDDIVRIGISRGVPRRSPAGYKRFPPLYPGAWFRSASEDEYVRLYGAEVLSHLDPGQLVANLLRISGHRPLALLCFERCGIDGWCHRGLAALHIYDGTGLEVREYGFDGVGMNHPMLPQRIQNAK